MQKSSKKKFVFLFSLIIVGCFFYLSYSFFNFADVAEYLLFIAKQPIPLLIILSIYGISFLLRAFAWYLYLGKQIRFIYCLHPLWYSLFLNHLLPFKVGDAARAFILTYSNKKISIDVALQSVVVMRSIDLFTLLLFSGIGSYLLIGQAFIKWNLVVALVLLIFCSLLTLYLFKNVKKESSLLYKLKALLMKHMVHIKDGFKGRKGPIIVICIIFSWVSEAIVVYGIAVILGNQLNYFEAIWVNSMAVAGGIFQVLPGGIATYEAIMSFALSTIDIDIQDAYYISLLSHGLKFLFSYIVGLYVLIVFPIPLKVLRSLFK